MIKRKSNTIDRLVGAIGSLEKLEVELLTKEGKTPKQIQEIFKKEKEVSLREEDARRNLDESSRSAGVVRGIDFNLSQPSRYRLSEAKESLEDLRRYASRGIVPKSQLIAIEKTINAIENDLLINAKKYVRKGNVSALEQITNDIRRLRKEGLIDGYFTSSLGHKDRLEKSMEKIEGKAEKRAIKLQRPKRRLLRRK